MRFAPIRSHPHLVPMERTDEDVMAIVREGEVTSFEEMLLPYRELLTPFAMLTPAMPPGVMWHCERCRYHRPTTTLLHRPNHCEQPMEAEAWTSLYEFFRTEA
jgi:hypothetical protein